MPVEGPTRGHHVVDVEKVARRDANVLVLAQSHELGSAPRLVVVAVQSLTRLGHQGVTGGGGEGHVVADGGDQLGIALDGLDQGPARSEQQAQAPGGFGGFPEGGDQERALVGVHDEVAQAEEPEVGVGREREPVEDERKELGHEPGAARQATGEVLHRSPGPRGVGEPEGGEASGHRLGRHHRSRGCCRCLGQAASWPGVDGGEGLEQAGGRRAARGWPARRADSWRSASSNRAVAESEASSR